MQNTRDMRSITAEQSCRVAEVAKLIPCGKRQVYEAIEKKALRAAKLNGRGDLRVLGAWIIDWLETLASKREGAAG